MHKRNKLLQGIQVQTVKLTQAKNDRNELITKKKQNKRKGPSKTRKQKTDNHKPQQTE